MKNIGYGGWLVGLAAGLALVFTIPAMNSAGAVAQHEAPATSSMSLGQGFADIVDKVSPAVVNISVTKSAPVVPAVGIPDQRFPQGDNPFDQFFGRFFDMPGIPQQPQEAQALGSGFLIDADGYVVTNNHVIDGATQITVTLQDERQFDATLVGRDEKTDLALLKIDGGASLPYVELGDSDRARVGDWVLAIGNPFGLGGTATAGIVSARGRDIQSGPYDDYLQIDAPINSGNSGGPVFNADGKVVGVNTAIYSPSGGSVGIGFAIPANQVKTIVAELRDRGAVTRGWLGVQIQDMDDDLAASLGLAASSGALVAEVVDGSPADRAGIKVGDVITALDGMAVDTPRTLSRLVADSDPDERVRMTIWRNGAERKLNVTLGQSEPTSAAATPAVASSSATAKLGLELRELNADYRSRLGLSEDTRGVLIAGVENSSPAARKGVRSGDVLIAVNGEQVSTTREAMSAIDAATQESGHTMLLLRRGDGQRFVSLALS